MATGGVSSGRRAVLYPSPRTSRLATPSVIWSCDLISDISAGHRKHRLTEPGMDIERTAIPAAGLCQVSIIQGSTGSGKTTQVPQYILDFEAWSSLQPTFSKSLTPRLQGWQRSEDNHCDAATSPCGHDGPVPSKWKPKS